VAVVAVKFAVTAAFAVAPEATVRISEPLKSPIVSVPAVTLKVSFHAPPCKVSFPAPPVKLSA